MLTSHEILDQLMAKPFQPFRIRMSSGRTFDVRHPEMMQVGVNSFTVYNVSDNSSDDGQTWQKVSLMLIESLEPIESQSGLTGGL